MVYDYFHNKFDNFKYFVATWAFVETFLLAGHRAGWASLVFVLKKENIYRFLCDNTSQLPVSYNYSMENDTSHLRLEIAWVNGGFQRGDNSSTDTGCPEQDAMFEFCLTITTVVATPVSLLVSQLNYLMGVRITRLVSVFFLMTGSLAFGMISQDRPWLMFIGYICVVLGGIHILQTNIQVSYMFTKYGSTIIGFMCGGYDASASVYLGVKLAHEQGIPLSMSFLFIGCSNILLVISTFLFLPKDFIRPPQNTSPLSSDTDVTARNSDSTSLVDMSEKTGLIRKSANTSIKTRLYRLLGRENRIDKLREESSIAGSLVGHVDNISSRGSNKMKKHSIPPLVGSGNSVPECASIEMTKQPTGSFVGSNGMSVDTGNDMVQLSTDSGNCFTVNGDKEVKQKSTLIEIIFSPLYMLQLLWAAINQLLFFLFLGALNAWLGHITNGAEQKVSHFTNFVFYAMLSAPIFSVLSGAAIDCLYWTQSDSRDHKARSVYSLAGPAALTSLTGVLLCACVIAEREGVTYVIGLLAVIYRSELYSYWGAFIRVLYPTEYFAVLYGIMLVFGGVIIILQYPLFLWCQSAASGYREVYGMLGVLTLLTLAQPAYLIHSVRKMG